MGKQVEQIQSQYDWPSRSPEAWKALTVEWIRMTDEYGRPASFSLP